MGHTSPYPIAFAEAELLVLVKNCYKKGADKRERPIPLDGPYQIPSSCSMTRSLTRNMLREPYDLTFVVYFSPFLLSTIPLSRIIYFF